MSRLLLTTASKAVFNITGFASVAYLKLCGGIHMAVNTVCRAGCDTSEQIPVTFKYGVTSQALQPTYTCPD